MRVRASDPPVKITREVSLQWLITNVGAIIALGVTMYFTLQSQGEKIVEMKKSIDTLVQSSNSTQQEIQGLKYEQRDLNRRLAVVEARGEKP